MQLLDTFFDWHQIWLVLPDLFETGLLNTLILAACATVIGLIIGIVLCLGAISRHAILRYPCRAYIDLFRGLPVVLTIFLLGEGLPFAGFHPLGHSSYPYGIATLGLIAAAYIAEIFRSGIQAVPVGQMEAARALGMPHLAAMRIVIIPQGVRNVLPALTNQFIGTIKDSSLVYLLGFTIGQRELYRIGQDAAQQTGNLSPLVAAGVLYLLLTVPLTHLVNYLDKRLKTGRRLAATAVEPESAPLAGAVAS